MTVQVRNMFLFNRMATWRSLLSFFSGIRFEVGLLTYCIAWHGKSFPPSRFLDAAYVSHLGVTLSYPDLGYFEQQKALGSYGWCSYGRADAALAFDIVQRFPNVSIIIIVLSTFESSSPLDSTWILAVGIL